MPELPELEVMAEALTERLLGRQVTAARVLRPTVLRILQPGCSAADYLQGASLSSFGRRAKLLLIGLGKRGWCAIHFMYWGRLRLCPAVEPPRVRDYLSLDLDDGQALRYNDQRGMGKIYLTTDLAAIPGWAELGLEPLGADFLLEPFCAGLHASKRAVKAVLKEGTLAAGIGNAYVDEILFAARIYPFREADGLSPAECEALFEAVRSVLAGATALLRDKTMGVLEHEQRAHLLVHRHGGQPCPRCGHTISQDEINKHITSYCPVCQPGPIIRREPHHPL